MDLGQIRLSDGNKVLVDNCYRTTSSWERFRGLIGRMPLSDSTALFLDPSDCIHTFFMRYPIDLVYLDENLCVKKAISLIKPWRISACFQASCVLALSGGSVKRHAITLQKQLVWSLKYNLW
ncbi:MAG: DUF192 domain-containing protein [Pseudomonadota bacterium]|nr:DUF192 domain-containing protein [Pseudomonadota bacterium]